MKVEALQKYRPLVRPLLFGLVIAIHIIVLVCVRFSVKEAALEARNSIPLRPYEDSSICKKAWLEDMVDYTTDCAMFYLEIAEIAGEQ